MQELGDEELLRRGMDTLVASWGEYARGAVDAQLRHLPGVTAAVFTCEPERGVYNNAVLAPALRPAGRADALDAMEAAYAAAGITRFAAWVHEGDTEMRQDLERRGYALDTSTLAMGMSLVGTAHARVPADVELGPATWGEYLESEDLPSSFLKGAEHEALHVLVARQDGEILAAALAYDLAGDCGIYNVGTRESARRRGLATAVTTAQLRAAQERGCQTASLQSTRMGEGVYGGVGFRTLLRILEYTPAEPGGLSTEEGAAT